LGVDDRIVDVGEDLELVGDPGVIAIARQAVADAAVASLRLDERLDHRVIGRLLANPAVGKDAHAPSLAAATGGAQCRCLSTARSTKKLAGMLAQAQFDVGSAHG
jgi:hypothetical protein